MARLAGCTTGLVVMIGLVRAASAQQGGPSVDALVGTGHVVQTAGMFDCEDMAHETVPFAAGTRMRWQSGSLVIRAGAAITADLAVAEDRISRCMYEAGGGGFADPPADQEVGAGNFRFGLEGQLTIGGDYRYFGFDVGAIVLTEPLWGAWAPPVLPSLSFRFGPRTIYRVLGIYDAVPTVTTGAMLRTGLGGQVGPRSSLEVGLVLGPDVGTVSVAATLAHQKQDGARLLGTVRLGAHVLSFGTDDLPEPQIVFALGYGWPPA